MPQQLEQPEHVSPAHLFSTNYAQARRRFLQAANQAALSVTSVLHALPGAHGESLALDVARFGYSEARSLLIVSSACHGVEGFYGSAVQLALIRDRSFHAQAQRCGVAVLYLHALNPWGFSWLRRTTEDNIDLNRNFVDFRAPLPVNHEYLSLADALVPRVWPPPADAEQSIVRFVESHGLRRFQAAVMRGQHDVAKGLFFAGHGSCWSQQAVRQTLRQHARACAHVGWIDLHTGLGPPGHGERVASVRADDVAGLARCRRWWGDGVTSLAGGSSVSAPLAGLLHEAIYTECTQADYAGIILECGTVHLAAMLDALRADQWLANTPDAASDDRIRVKRALIEAFCPGDPQWRNAVLGHGVRAAREAVRGLAGAG